MVLSLLVVFIKAYINDRFFHKRTRKSISNIKKRGTGYFKDNSSYNSGKIKES